MDVVVCGAQKPFMYGGAEMHQENLVRALQAAGHRAELVRLPVAWEKDRLFDSPLAWRLCPIDADLVIATNFPSYFVSHPVKVVWLFHQHRGAYDAVDAPWNDIGSDDVSLETQRLLTEWDARALGEARHVFTTSSVVADRLLRYTGLQGEPLHHPAPLMPELLEAGRGGRFDDYVFCPTRLDASKRPGKVLEAVAVARSGVRGVVAGRGVLADALAHQAKQLDASDRFSLPGFVSDADLVGLYADALAVVYAPADEDYGYVTLQAFAAGKPVITSADAGGVLEWVEDGVTGFVTDGSAEAMGAAIDTLAGDPERARAMGAAGRDRVQGLAWEPVVRRLVEAAGVA